MSHTLDRDSDGSYHQTYVTPAQTAPVKNLLMECQSCRWTGYTSRSNCPACGSAARKAT